MVRSTIVSRSVDVHGPDNFPTGCASSPDGTCVLTATASDGEFRIYDTPRRCLEGDEGEGGEGEDAAADVPEEARASLVSRQGGSSPSSSSASYAWYPLMSSSSPLTSVFAT